MGPSPPNGWHDVLVFTPEHFEDALEAVLAVREQHTVVVNLSRMEPELAQRTADFVCGGVHALDGHQQRIGHNVFLFAPASVQIAWLTRNGPDLQDRSAPPQLEPAPAVQPKQ